jgi:hypothetical protein
LAITTKRWGNKQTAGMVANLDASEGDGRHSEVASHMPTVTATVVP